MIDKKKEEKRGRYGWHVGYTRPMMCPVSDYWSACSDTSIKRSRQLGFFSQLAIIHGRKKVRERVQVRERELSRIRVEIRSFTVEGIGSLSRETIPTVRRYFDFSILFEW